MYCKMLVSLESLDATPSDPPNIVSGSTPPISSRAKPTTGGRFTKAVIALSVLL
jgi:hypothetical protein